MRSDDGAKMKYAKPILLIVAFAVTTLILIEVVRVTSIFSDLTFGASTLTVESKIKVAILVTLWVALLVTISNSIITKIRSLKRR